MKKKIMLLIAVVTAMGLVACGKDTDSKESVTVNETTESVDSTEPVESEKEESGETEAQSESETTQSDVQDDDKYSKVSYWIFPTDDTVANGYTHKYIYADNANWSYNETHFTNVVGEYSIDISWNGPAELGVKANYVNNSMYLYDNNNNSLAISDIIAMNDASWDAYSNLTAEQWQSTGYCIEYDGTEYFSKEQIGDIIVVTFTMETITNKGYGKQFVDKNNNAIYAFYYRETSENYDASRAFEIISSIQMLDEPLAPTSEIK